MGFGAITGSVQFSFQAPTDRTRVEEKRAVTDKVRYKDKWRS
jgi:hypothetical protein